MVFFSLFSFLMQMNTIQLVSGKVKIARLPSCEHCRCLSIFFHLVFANMGCNLSLACCFCFAMVFFFFVNCLVQNSFCFLDLLSILVIFLFSAHFFFVKSLIVFLYTFFFFFSVVHRMYDPSTTQDTNYYFDVNAGHLPGALDIFSRFFVDPLFTESATGRELSAIDNENSKNLMSDSWRLIQVCGLREGERRRT